MSLTDGIHLNSIIRCETMERRTWGAAGKMRYTYFWWSRNAANWVGELQQRQLVGMHSFWMQCDKVETTRDRPNWEWAARNSRELRHLLLLPPSPSSMRCLLWCGTPTTTKMLKKEFVFHSFHPFPWMNPPTSWLSWMPLHFRLFLCLSLEKGPRNKKPPAHPHVIDKNAQWPAGSEQEGDFYQLLGTIERVIQKHNRWNFSNNWLLFFHCHCQIIPRQLRIISYMIPIDGHHRHHQDALSSLRKTRTLNCIERCENSGGR